MANKPMPMVGCDKFYWAPMLTDIAPGGSEEGEYTTGTILPFQGLTQIGLARNVQTGGFAADNDPNYATAVQDGERNLTAGLADIPPEVYSAWFGQDYGSGAVRDRALSATEIWCAYRIKSAGGGYRYFKYWRVRPAPNDESQDTQGTSISFNGKTCTLMASTSSFHGTWRMWADDSDPELLEAGITPEILEAQWFSDPLFDPATFTPVIP